MLAVAALVVLGWYHSNQQQSAVDSKINDLSSAVNQNASAALAQKSALAKANHCIKTKGCHSTVPTPSGTITGASEVPGEPGSAGASGASGASGAPGRSITVAQAKRAVASLCAHDACAPQITFAQAVQAVSTYCDGNGQCQGPKGDLGASGTPAPPLTPDQVLAGVATYCDANNGCAGPEGPQGKPGADGASGQPGEPGQPPYSWQWTFLGINYTCTRDDPFDPDKPQYSCAPTPIVSQSS